MAAAKLMSINSISSSELTIALSFRFQAARVYPWTSECCALTYDNTHHLACNYRNKQTLLFHRCGETHGLELRLLTNVQASDDLRLKSEVSCTPAEHLVAVPLVN